MIVLPSDLIVKLYSGVGKSAILNRLAHDRFDSDHNCTIGVEFGSLAVDVEGTRMKLQIWDTAGMECFRSVTKIFYRDAHAVFLCYSITKRDSFESLQSWLKEVADQCYPDIMIFLVGTKQDL